MVSHTPKECVFGLLRELETTIGGLTASNFEDSRRDLLYAIQKALSWEPLITTCEGAYVPSKKHKGVRSTPMTYGW